MRLHFGTKIDFTEGIIKIQKQYMMKKVLLAMLMITCMTKMNAQEVKFGLKTGLNIATIRGNNLDVDPRKGIHLGGIAELKLTSKFSIQPELLFSQLGTENSNNKLKIDYISLPLMAKYYLIKGFSVEAGPQFSFLVKDDLEVILPNNVSNLDPNTNNFDLGLNVGMGYQFEKGLFLQTRYSLGMTNIEANPDVKNGTFQLSLGYQF